MKHILTLLFIFVVINISAQSKVAVILLAGQSNMAGSGNYDALSADELKRIDAVKNRVRLTTKGRENIPLSYYLAPAKTKKYKFEKFFGPELFIGLTLAEKHPDTEFLLIKTSMGGTALYGAWNPNWSAEKAKAVENTEEKQSVQLCKEHIALINKELTRLDSENKEYEIIGMAWMQGENDAAKEVSALSYKENLTALINFYRNTFTLPELPFVYGQINSTYGKFADGPQCVRNAMKEVAKTTDNCEMIPTSTDRSWNDYPKHEDNTHYNTVGQKRLGTKMGQLLIKMQ